MCNHIILKGPKNQIPTKPTKYSRVYDHVNSLPSHILPILQAVHRGKPADRTRELKGPAAALASLIWSVALFGVGIRNENGVDLLRSNVAQAFEIAAMTGMSGYPTVLSRRHLREAQCGCSSSPAIACCSRESCRCSETRSL